TVADFGLDPRIGGKSFGDFFGDGNIAVFTAGAAERQRCVMLIFRPIAFDDRFHHGNVAVYERCDAFTFQHIGRNLLVVASKWPQFRYPVWVGYKTGISNIVRVLRDAVFKTKRHDVQPNDDGARLGEQFGGRGSEIVDVEVRSIDHHFSLIPQGHHKLTFSSDTFEDRTVALQWVRAAKGFKPAHQDFICGVKEQYAKFGTVSAELVHSFLKGLEEFLRPYINHQRQF